MNRSRFALCSTTALTAALVATPAAAQDATQVPPPNPAATAQQSPADPQPNADAPQSPAATAGTSDNPIVVTGLRRALQSARNIKRNSDQVVDAIVAEDIGKLPDITVSDTAARIPGIQVERARGEAGRVLLRGFDNTYYPTTYNGREIFTAEARSVSLGDFPSNAIAAIEAFKTSTANLIEPGIAGLINVRSRRPFDFKGLEVAGSVWGTYPLDSRDLTPNGTVLVSDRWRVGDGEMGALINFSYTKLHYRDSIRRYHFNPVAGLAGGTALDWPQLQINEGVRTRPSINGAWQWRPSPDLELYAEGLWQGYRDDVSDRELDFPLWGAGGGDYSNVQLDDQGHVVSGTVTNPGACCSGTDLLGDLNSFPVGFQGATKRRTNTYQFAVGGSYNAGPLRISADLARTSSTFKLQTESVDFLIPTHNYTVDWNNGEPGGSGPTFDISGLDFSDPANYNYRGFFEDRQRPHGDDWQGRLDFEYSPAGFLGDSKIQWGVRYVDRTASDYDAQHYSFAGTLGIPISDVPLDYVLYPSGFRYDDTGTSPTQWIGPSFDSVWSNISQLRQFDVDLGIPGDTNEPAINPATQFRINEKSLAGYGQLNFKFNAGDTSFDGILGLRAVRTKEDMHGFSVYSPDGLPQVVTPVDYRKSYWDWLPNANLNVRFARDFQLRLAATRTRTRPTFQQLNPAQVLDAPPSPGCTPDASHNCYRTGHGGNPYLDPLTSNNFDASLEYYFSSSGFASVGAFHRDMKGFVLTRTSVYPDVDPVSGQQFQITGPVNSEKATINGVEAQVRTFLDFGGLPRWLRSFGIEANVTYIDAKADFALFCDPNPATGTDACTPSTAPGHDYPNATVRSLQIPDVSKWTANLVGMYENGPLSLRLAYNWRGAYPEGSLDQRTNLTLQGHAHPAPRLDFSSSYTVNDNLTVFADWTNILRNKPFTSDLVQVNYNAGVPTTVGEFPMFAGYNESVLSAGIRFRFGHDASPPPPPAQMVLPPPPPAAEPAPVVEEPVAPPPPPPPPEASGERGQ
jgi:iron complex outermembrane receptor protein